MRGLFNLIIFGAIIGFLITGSNADISAVFSTVANVFVEIISFIGDGLLHLAEAMK